MPTADRTAPDAGDYDALTFDCYGTLIDWAGGLLAHLQPLLLSHDAHVLDDFVLDFFAATEPAVQSAAADGAAIGYADVLREVLRRLGTRLGFSPTPEALDAFAQSAGQWQPFPDTVDALARLGARFELTIVSNVDNDIFRDTARALDFALPGAAAAGWAGRFRHVVTAEDVGVYKPDKRMFEAALAALGADPARVLHVAQSVYHDIAPAAELGLATAHIRRGASAAKPAAAAPDFAFDSLAEFADAILGAP